MFTKNYLVIADCFPTGKIIVVGFIEIRKSSRFSTREVSMVANA